MIKKFDPVLTIILSIVTCGIYTLYIYYYITRDLNTIDEPEFEDGMFTNPTTIVAVSVVLTFISLPILVSIPWYAVQGNRIKKICRIYDIEINETGSYYVLFLLLGSLTCGITYILAGYKFYKNYNVLVDEYNTKNSYTN